jgi:hypothetical protein
MYVGKEHKWLPINLSSDINNLNNEMSTYCLVHSRTSLVGEVIPEALLPTMQLSASSENQPSPTPHYKIQRRISRYCLNVKFSCVHHQKGWRVEVRLHSFLITGWRRVDMFTPRPLSPRKGAPDTQWIGGWVSHRANLGALENRILAPARNRTTMPQSSGPYCSHCTDWAILAPKVLCASQCIVHSLPQNQTFDYSVWDMRSVIIQNVNSGSVFWKAMKSVLTVQWAGVVQSALQASDVLDTPNISQFFVSFTPIKLVWLQLHSTWAAWCIWIIGTCLLKPHVITPLLKPMSNNSITLFKNCCQFWCVLDKVSCLELSVSYHYSTNNFCVITIITYLK